MLTLTFGELVWTVDVVATHDDDWKLEALHVRVDKHLGCRLACGVWVGGRQYARLQQVVIVILDFTVDFICRNVDEALDAHLFRTLQHDMCPVHIGVREGVRVSKAQVHMRLRCEVEDGIYVVPLHTFQHFGWVCDISMVEREVSFLVQHSGVVQ